MTDREKLIELLTEPLPVAESPLGDECAPKMKMGMIFAKKVADHLLANGVTIQTWIPVSERLPGKNGDYLVFIRSPFGGWREVAGFAKDGGEVNEYDLGGCENVWYDYDSEYGYIAFESVTHWMPLPNPPKEVENG